MVLLFGFYLLRKKKGGIRNVSGLCACFRFPVKEMTVSDEPTKEGVSSDQTICFSTRVFCFSVLVCWGFFVILGWFFLLAPPGFQVLYY